MTAQESLGTSRTRLEARDKVTGGARYAYEYPVEGAKYGFVVGSTIAKGRVSAIDASAALALEGVVEVMTHENAPRLETGVNAELEILQSGAVGFYGQTIALVIADSLDIAREAAGLVEATYDAEPHASQLRVESLDQLFDPETLPDGPSDTAQGDPDAALRKAPVVLDVTFRLPAQHNNPMEPHATIARWQDGTLEVHDATQGASTTRDTVAKLFGLEPDEMRLFNAHVGGGFGSKGSPRPNVILAAQAAKLVGAPVKLAMTRQQMWPLTGYRSPTIQRLQLGADSGGKLLAIVHDTVAQTSSEDGFVEECGVGSRVMYAAEHRRTTHRARVLDVPHTSWMRGPGHTPGSYALESAMDELAYACKVDPVALRLANEPDEDPELHVPFSSRNFVACLKEGAERFGWADRDPQPGLRREGSLLVGTGMAGSTYPTRRSASSAKVVAHPGGTFTVSVAATDIGTGARTVLQQIAADALGVATDVVTIEIGDSALPHAPVAGGSSGTASWGSAIVGACKKLLAQLGGDAPGADVEASYDTTDDIEAEADVSRHAFGAFFTEVTVDAFTGEVRVRRLLGVFAAGRILNPHTARSQFIGGMIMGIGMALHEESTIDHAFGDFVGHDLAGYHVPSHADIADLEAIWVDEQDDQINPMGAKGVGEIGMVGSPAAIGNAVFHATGRRFRELPLRPDRVLAAMRG